MLPPLEFGLDPARGGQHVVLRQQLVELLLPAIINNVIRVMLFITVTFGSVSVILIPPQLGRHQVMCAEVLLLCPIEEAVDRGIRANCGHML